MSSSFENNQSARIPELDGIRGLAVLMVVLWHYIGCQVEAAVPASELILLFTKLFWSGVDLFFVLSGFLIGGILLKNKGSGNYFKAFYIKRIVRIFPLYYLLIFLYLIFYFSGMAEGFPWLTKNPMPLWSYITFTQNYFMGNLETFGNNWFAITWSLAIEEQFYLLLPLIIFFMPYKRIPVVLILAICLAPFLRFNIHNFHSFVSLFCRMDSLLVGVFLAYLMMDKGYTDLIARSKTKIYIMFFFLLLGFFVMHFKGFGPLKNTWLAFMYAFLILISVSFRESKLSDAMRNKWLGQLGVISYGVYIFHQLISGLLHQLILGTSPQIVNAYGLLTTVLSFAITIAISLLSFHFYEKPILKIGQKYSY